MEFTVNLNRLEDYRLFIKAKRLPMFSCIGHTISVPDEYAYLLRDGITKAVDHVAYEPLPGLFDYQGDTSALAIRKRKFAVFMEPGYGKTLIDYEYARYAMAAVRSQTRSRCLLVAPLMVVRQMIEEYERFYPNAIPLEQVPAAGLQDWLNAPGQAFGITNYEAIRDGLRPGNLAILILSESSMLKSMYGKWGARLIELGRGLEWKLCETGTPAPNDRIEYANHAVFLDAFPTTNAFLARYFVNRGQTQERWELKPHALAPFYRDLSHWCIFITNPATYGWKDNVDTIPPINVHIHDIELTDQQREAVFRLTGKLFLDEAGGIVTRSKLSRIGKGDDNGKKVDALKPAFVRDLIASWPDESTILWCRHNAEQDAIERMFPDAGSIAGKTPYEDRASIIDDFKSGRTRLLISKPECLGFGLNLQIATRQVFNSCSDSYEDFFQAVKRSNRVGSTKPLNVHIPVSEIERPMIENVLRKAARVQHDAAEQERIFKGHRWVA